MQRRYFLGLAGLVAAPKTILADGRELTPSQTEGPFYPRRPIPLRDDLVLDERAVTGTPMRLGGRVLNARGEPQARVKVEIWQCDGAGLYRHPGQPNGERVDENFAGFGAVFSDAQGAYGLRTLYPVPYTGRPPHIHVKLWRGERELLTTQLYLQGETGSGLLSWFGERQALQIAPRRDAQGRMAAGFDFVV